MKALSYGNILKFGVLLGLSLCLYTTLMWLTRLDSTHLGVGQYLDIAVGLLPIGLILSAISEQRKVGRLTIWHRLGVAVGVGLLAQVLYAPFLYCYHTYIKPDWFSFVLATKRAELAAAGQSAPAIAAELARRQVAHARQVGLFSGFVPAAVVFPVLVALLSLLFVRNKTVPALA